MDASVRQELSSLLEQLTHSGSATLDPNHTKKLKSICRSSDMYLRAAYEIIMTHLSKDHAEVRLSSFQVIKELFSRSHLFRELLISDFQKFSSLVTGTDPHSPLPLPKQVAAQLKEKSLLAIREWNDKYGDGYPKLRLGYNYLKINKKVKFDELVAQTEVARRRQEERAGRQRAVLQQKIQEVKQEMKDLTRDIEECMVQITSCFNLLMPRFDLPDIYSSNPPSDGTSHLGPLRAVPEMSLPGREGGVGVAKPSEERDRTMSSCSFESLSENDDESEGMDDPSSEPARNEKQTNSISQQHTNSDQQLSVESAHSTSVGDPASDGEGRDSDSEFLRRHYGIPSTGGSGKGVVKGKVVAGGKGKSSVRLTASQPSSEVRIDEQFREVPEGPNKMQSSSNSESDSDSELEWEDVDPIQLQAAPHRVSDFDLQAHGIATHGFSISLQLDAVPVVQEDEDNSSILTTLRESKQLLVERYLPTINRWMEWLSKSGGEDKPLRDAIDLKHKVQVTLDKFERIEIIYKEPLPAKEAGQRSEDVGMTVDTVTVTNPEWEIQSHSNVSTFDMELDPTTPQAQIAKLKKKLSAQAKESSDQAAVTTKKTQSAKATLHSKAPVVPFDMDLYHWETPTHKLQPLTKAPVGSLHRFWVQEREVDVSTDEQARLRCRTITYPGTFEPVVKTCRARLPSGKLCPRMDRLKCPFHGPIIPRDENGNPVPNSGAQGNQTPSSDSHSTLLQSSSPIVPLDQHMAEAIRDAKGTELLQGSKEKKKKGGKAKVKKHPGLTDLKVEVDTPRARLERKVMSKKALKRVSTSVDAANAKKYKDKFGYSFNYALSQ